MRSSLRLLFCSAVIALPAAVGAQQATLSASNPETMAAAMLPDAPEPQQSQPAAPAGSAAPKQQSDKRPARQPKRILGLMPNYRAVSAGETPPPPTPRQAFKIATQNSFDYSAIVFVGLTSLIAEGNDSHPSLGKGVPGFWGYSWRGFVDKTDGNYWVVFVLPTFLHEDERYYALGKGGIWKRGIYSSSRVLITPDYHGHNTVNGSELLGRGIANGISTTYYPQSDRTASALASKYAFSLLRDAGTNVFREFWPDVASHLPHKKSASD